MATSFLLTLVSPTIWASPSLALCGFELETRFYLACFAAGGGGTSCLSFGMYGTGCTLGNAAPEPGCTCDPLDLTFVLTVFESDCCVGTITINVTE